MIQASLRAAVVIGTFTCAMVAGSPAVAGPVFLTLDRPSNQIAVAAAAPGMNVYNFFWSPAEPPPYFVGVHSYLIMPGSEWQGGTPVDNGMLAAVIRSGSCRAGARYELAQLKIGEYVHRLRDVVVTGCKHEPTESGKYEWMTLAFAEVH
jgi:hypothetical protein